MPIHVAISRRVKIGREAEFQQTLRDFFEKSFAQGGVLGAHMLTPPPGSTSREFGLLRTFADEKARDAFFGSGLFKDWEAKVRTLTEGEPVHRELHGLEAWFCSPSPPPRWKMAIATFFGVFPLATVMNVTLVPAIVRWNFFLRSAVLDGCIIVLLTWAVMPLITRALHSWLQGKENFMSLKTSPAPLFPKSPVFRFRTQNVNRR